jgi:hypothetical protein
MRNSQRQFHTLQTYLWSNKKLNFPNTRTVFHYSFERFQTDPDFVPIFCLVLTSSPKTNLTNTALYANQTKIAPFSNQTTTIPTNNKDLNRAFKNYAQFVHLMYNADDDPQWKTLSNASSTTSLAPKINTPDADDFAYEWWDCKWPTGDSVIAPPAGYPLLISRLINTSYRKKICDYYFPSNNTLPHNSLHYRTIDEMNQWTGSWSDRPGSKRMLFINGKLDPWLHLTVSSRFRPGGSMKSTGDVVVKTMSKETHCPTYLGCLEREVECKKVVEESMAQLQKWVLEFPGRTNWTRTGLRNM